MYVAACFQFLEETVAFRFPFVADGRVDDDGRSLLVFTTRWDTPGKASAMAVVGTLFVSGVRGGTFVVV
jgi:hypothetical protein